MASEERPAGATYSLYLMIGAGGLAIALGFYWLIWGGNIVGGTVFLVLGVAYVYGSRALHTGESWGWGAGVFAGIFYVLFGVFLLPFGGVLVALAIAIMILLYRERDYYGMVRYDPKQEDRKKEELKTQRMQNPEGLHCAHCGRGNLWIAPDGSAFCLDCKTGTISLKPPA